MVAAGIVANVAHCFAVVWPWIVSLRQNQVVFVGLDFVVLKQHSISIATVLAEVVVRLAGYQFRADIAAKEVVTLLQHLIAIVAGLAGLQLVPPAKPKKDQQEFVLVADQVVIKEKQPA